MWDTKDTWMSSSEPREADLGFHLPGVSPAPSRCHCLLARMGYKDCLGTGSGHRRRSLTPLQVILSVLSQQELIPGGCGQLWGSLWLPGAIGSEHAPGKEPPRSHLSSLQPLGLVCSLPREPQNPSPVPSGSNGHSPPHQAPTAWLLAGHPPLGAQPCSP